MKGREKNKGNHWPIAMESKRALNGWMSERVFDVCGSMDLLIGDLFCRKSHNAALGRRSLVLSLCANCVQRIDRVQRRIELGFAPNCKRPEWKPLSTTTIGKILGMDHVSVMNLRKRKESVQVFYVNKWLTFDEFSSIRSILKEQQ